MQYIMNDQFFLNVSIHAPFEELNWLLFSLFVCGTLIDLDSGLTFSLTNFNSWNFIVEVPYSDKIPLSIEQNFNQILPLLSLVCPSGSTEEITAENYQLFIADSEELVARFLKAYDDRTIDRMCSIRNMIDVPVDFPRLSDDYQCRIQIYNALKRYANELKHNKIIELSFTKFLYRRILFFIGFFYRYNQTIKLLGSTVMKQMIEEAKQMVNIDFTDGNFRKVYLVYDPEFSLHILHSNWNSVNDELKKLFNYNDPLKGPEFKNKDPFCKCLSWLINIPYEQFVAQLNETKFVLTESFMYKLFHVHERKLTRMPLIIEGVGKTFLLKFYSSLLNCKLLYDRSLDIAPRVIEHTSQWLLLTIINGIIEPEQFLLQQFLQRLKLKLNEVAAANNEMEENNVIENYADINDEVNEDYFDNESLQHREPQPLAIPPFAQQDVIQNEPIDNVLLQEIKLSLQNYIYNIDILKQIWKTILTVTQAHALNLTQRLITELHEHITSELVRIPLIEPTPQLQSLLEETRSQAVQTSIQIFNEYISYTKTKPLFYRLLLHPGVTEEQLEEFMFPICELAKDVPAVELVVFFDEVNTSSCLGFFKEMFTDRTMHGKEIPENIFFTAAINPHTESSESNDNKQNEMIVHRRHYLVHQLPQSLEHLKVRYGTLPNNQLYEYIQRKIKMFTIHLDNKQMPLEDYAQGILCDAILNAQEFCANRLGENSVSQREIQRCFHIIDFFWKMRYDDEFNDQDEHRPNPVTCIALSIALIYYFRLPTREDRLQRRDLTSPTREEFAETLSNCIGDFDDIVQNELEKFVTNDNFLIPNGVALNQAVREHIFSIVVSIVTRTPLCIIGAPGQSKTLSFQIVLQNLQGPQLSLKSFCKRLPAVDPFFCLGSKYSRSEDIATIFDRAIKREQQYQQNRMETRCVVFLDEASLPDEKKMVLKVLHPYLDECKAAFVAVSNQAFDAANANRMMCVYRSLPSENDQKVLAYGCLGLHYSREHEQQINQRLERIITGLIKGYRQVLHSEEIPHIFHDRDFIYMLRELRFELVSTKNNNENEWDIGVNGISPISLLRSLENNFNGISKEQFRILVNIFFRSIQSECKEQDFRMPQETQYRNTISILRDSMQLDSNRRRLYGRYKLVIDETEDESAARLLFQVNVLDPNPDKTTVFRMSDFVDDINNELKNVEILSTIKLCMETGKTILMINTGRIHGSLYDVFNQNFSIMATVAIGPKTLDCIVHEQFQCIVHIKQSEMKDIPAPFLSRFQKYSLSINDFYRIQLEKLSIKEQNIMDNVEAKAKTFVQHYGQQYVYGFTDNTLYSCMLSLIKTQQKQPTPLVTQLIQNEESEQKKTENNEVEETAVNEQEQNIGRMDTMVYLGVHQYSQLTIKSKSLIEQNTTDIQQCLLRSVISRLIQLVTAESLALKLPSFEDSVARWICTDYFNKQEHFNIENFVHQLLSVFNDDYEELLDDQNNNNEIDKNNSITTKVTIFTRTSSYILGLNKQSSSQLFSEDNMQNNNEKVDILNLAAVENS
ncbi:unnamed protein product [Didymodactylos carnosus]|uniref:Uncharacterized protein n=1 Tax=Didymodactylos carnosus TaxID=1234261 RepID=A0A814W6X4_9BILA|nr:unnamed protein product [Didymodactylos carnosus]CAF3962668.1 unnamed protein product [Didymodactylos carnosus]